MESKIGPNRPSQPAPEKTIELDSPQAKRGEKVDKALEAIRSLQKPIDKAADFAMQYTPQGRFAAYVSDVKTPEERTTAAKEQEALELQQQIDAMKFVQEKYRIKELKERLTSGN